MLPRKKEAHKVTTSTKGIKIRREVKRNICQDQNCSHWLPIRVEQRLVFELSQQPGHAAQHTALLTTLVAIVRRF